MIIRAKGIFTVRQYKMCKTIIQPSKLLLLSFVNMFLVFNTGYTKLNIEYQHLQNIPKFNMYYARVMGCTSLRKCRSALHYPRQKEYFALLLMGSSAYMRSYKFKLESKPTINFCCHQIPTYSVFYKHPNPPPPRHKG